MLRKILPLLLIPVALQAQTTANPYEPDSTFGIQGAALFPPSLRMEPFTVLEQTDRRILLVNRSVLHAPATLPLVRLKPTGRPDSTTGTNGVASVYFSNLVDYYAVRQVSGGIVIGGTQLTPPTSVIRVTKLKDNLTPDSTFGSNGAATFSFGNPYVMAYGQTVIQPDGKIISGASTIPYNATVQYRPAHGRLLPNGILDPTYGSGGKVVTPYIASFQPPAGTALDARQMAMAMQPDGKLLVSGRVNRTPSPATSATTQIFIARHKLNGSLDSTFANNGLLLMPPDPGSEIYEIPNLCLDGQGKIYLVGKEFNWPNDFISVRKFSSTGVRQMTYGTNGVLRVAHPFTYKTYTQFGSAVDSTGRFYIGSSLDTGSAQHFALAAYTPTGQPDAAFAPNGLVEVPRNNSEVCNSITLQADGGILLSGYSWGTSPSTPTLIRLKRRNATPVSVAKPIVAGSDATLVLSPNPSTGTISCSIRLPQAQDASLSVFNALGQRVSQIPRQHFSQNATLLITLSAELANGLYFVRLETAAATLTAPFVLSR